MYTVIFSQQVIDYYDTLKNYLSHNFGEKIKTQTLKQEEEKFENLKTFPFLGRPAEKISVLLKEYYVIIDKHSYIFYRVFEDKKTISVELILSTKEDIIKKINKFIAD